MLLLLFETGDSRYALETRRVVEVIPFLQPKKIPGAPPYVAGIINFRGQPVPVFDLCVLADGTPCRPYYSTRIILVHYQLGEGKTRLIGLAAERAIDVISCDESDIRASGILLDKAGGQVALGPEREEIVQMFEVERVIAADIVRGIY